MQIPEYALKDLTTLKKERIAKLEFSKWKPIFPLKSAMNSRKKKIAVLDIEAEGWTGFLILGFYYLNKNFYISFDSMKDAIPYIFDYCRKNKIKEIFIHNGGKYDINFVIDASLKHSERFVFHSGIDRGASMLMVTIKDIINDQIISFKDSLGFIPMSLAKAGESYGVEVLKDSIDYKYMGEAFRNEDYLKKIFIDTYTTGKGEVLKRNKVFYKEKEIEKYTDFTKNSYSKLENITYFCNETKMTYRIYNRQDVENYLKKDCISLAQVIDKHFESPIIKDAGPAYTSAGQAMRIFRRFLKYELQSSTIEEDLFVRKAYMGGRTEVFKFFFDSSYDVIMNELSLKRDTLLEIVRNHQGKKIRCYDANSLYPTVMAKYNYPTRFRGIYREPSLVKKLYKEWDYGVWHVKVRVPKNLKIPPLGIEHKFSNSSKKYIFPTGTFSGHWTKQELDYAKTLGCRILEWYECAIYDSAQPIFKEFIETMYKRRREAQKAGDETTSIVTKLAMNSCYGKLGMDLLSKYTIVGAIEAEGNEPVYRDIEVIDYNGESHERLLFKKDASTEKMSTKVILACYVTSYARVDMHKEMMKVGEDNVWYTDTDSIFTVEEMQEGTELGDMKLEYMAESACFLAPKTYLIDDIIEFKYKTKKTMKGFDRFKVESVENHEFFEYWKGELGEIKALEKEKFMSFKTATQKGVMLGLSHNEFNEREILLKKYNRILKRKEKEINEFLIKKYDRELKVINDKILELGGQKWKSMRSQYDKRIMCDDKINTVPIHLCL